MLLQNACIVVAHPGDELLWFSSIADMVDRIIVCYPGGEEHQRALARHPLGIDSLGFDKDTPLHLVQQAVTKEVQGYLDVFTHNPWGENGQALHHAIHRMVAASHVATWFSNYSSHELSVQTSVTPIALPPNLDLVRQVREIYIDEGCWTTLKGHVWPDIERFARLANVDEVADQNFPIERIFP